MNSKNVQPQFYQSAPSCQMDLDEIETLVNNRLLKLEYIESRFPQAKNNVTTMDLLINRIEYEDIKTGDGNQLSIINWDSQKNNDIISHFILAIAFCKNEQHRNW